MCPRLTSTRTGIAAPYHRFPDGADLGAIPLARTVDLPAAVARVTGTQQPGIDVGSLAALDVPGKAVLLHTGTMRGSAHRPTPKTATS